MKNKIKINEKYKTIIIDFESVYGLSLSSLSTTCCSMCMGFTWLLLPSSIELSKVYLIDCLLIVLSWESRVSDTDVSAICQEKHNYSVR